jgi:hypothetical protein
MPLAPSKASSEERRPLWYLLEERRVLVLSSLGVHKRNDSHASLLTQREELALLLCGWLLSDLLIS